MVMIVTVTASVTGHIIVHDHLEHVTMLHVKM